MDDQKIWMRKLTRFGTKKNIPFSSQQNLDGFSRKSQDFISNSALKWAVDHPKANENLGCRKSGWEPPFSRKYRIIDLGTDHILVYNHN